MREFKEIVNDINEVYEYKTDQELYGKPEWWSDLKDVDGKLLGDCEDYCITIANRAAKAGISLSDMTLHLVATQNKPDHIILEYKGWYADCNTKGLMRSPPYKKISKRRLSESDWV
jgi:predicted transglutaminase-like cysteine proteinase